MNMNESAWFFLKRTIWAGLAALLPLFLFGQHVDWDKVVVDGPQANAVADELIVIYKDGSVRPMGAAPAQGRDAIGRRTWRPPASAEANHVRVNAQQVDGFKRVHGEQVRLPRGGGGVRGGSERAGGGAELFVFPARGAG